MKKLFNVVSLVLMLSMVLTTSVIADNVFADGDGVIPVTNQNMNFGTICAGEDYSLNALIAIERRAASNAANVYADSAVVTVTIISYSGDGLDPYMEVAPSTITLPANWTTLGFGTMSNSVKAIVELNTVEIGPYSGTVTFEAVGAGNNVTSLKRDVTMDVYATVESCVSEKITPTLVLAEPTTVTYNGLPQAANVVALDGDDEVDGTITIYYDGSTDEPIHVDNYAVTADFTPDDEDTYESLEGEELGDFEILPATLTVTADNKTVTYGDAPPALTYQITGFVLGEDEDDIDGEPLLSTTYIAGTPVSASPVAITVAMGTLVAANYDFTLVPGEITIGRAALTVTADDKTVTYGDAPPTLTYQITGFVAGELEANVVTGTPVLATDYFAGTPVADSPVEITVNVDGLSADNYTFTDVSGWITIDKALLTVTADDKTVTYGDDTPDLTYEITGFVLDELEADVVNGAPVLETDYVAGTPVADSPVDITVEIGTLAAANYAFTLVNGEINIIKATLIVTAENKTVTYGDATPDLTYKITGFVLNELEADVVSGTPDLSTTYVAGTSVADSPVDIIAALGDLASDNYTFSFVNGEITIDQAELTVKPNPFTSSIYFGETPPDFTPEYEGFVLGEGEADLDVAPTCAIVDYDGTVGTYVVKCDDGESVDYEFIYVDGSFEVKAWTATGFYRPVDMDKPNTIKGGRTVPLKFNVFAGDTELTDPAVVASLTWVYSGGEVPPNTTNVLTEETTGNTALRYDETEGQFIFNWKTPKVRGQYTITLSLADGVTTIVAVFNVTR